MVSSISVRWKGLQEASRFAYAISHVIAVVSFVYGGLWRRLPWCFAMLCCATILAVTYAPESREWVRDVYFNVEPLALPLRFAAAFEVARLLAPKGEQTRLPIALTLIGIAAASSVWAINAGTPLQTFVQLRTYAQIGTSVFMIALVVFLWSQRLWPMSYFYDYPHTLILLLYVTKQAVYSVLYLRGTWATMKTWQAADWPGLLISSLCCLLWGALAIWQKRAPKV
jgi:hypothetical protein